MVRRLFLLVASLALGGCFDFSGDLARCRDEGRCPLEDGGRVVVVPAGGLCSQGACWEHPFPVSVPITSLYAPNADELFAGGNSGVVVHLKGRSAEIAFLARPEPPAVDWPAVTGLAGCSTGVSAMSADRQLFTFGAQGFVPVDLGPQDFQPFVAQGWTGPGPTCAFVGNTGQAVWVGEERDGRVMTLGSPPGTQEYWRRMKAIGGTSTEDLWFASDRDVQRHSDDGGVGPDEVSVPDGGLNGVTGVCSLGNGQVFTSTADGIEARTTSGWQSLGGAQPFSAIACLPPGEVVASGDRLVRRCTTDGGCSDLESDEWWQSVTVSGGQALLGSRTGDLAMLSSSGPLALSRLSAGGRDELMDVALSPRAEAWAAGRHATLLHRTDAGWAAVDAGVGSDDLLAVAAPTDGRIIVAGAGGVLRVFNPDGGVNKPLLYDLNGMVVQNQKLNQDLRRLRQSGSTMWAVGTRGVILREADDRTWHVVHEGLDDLYDVQFNDAGIGWATGGGAAVIQSDSSGDNWALIRGPADAYTFLTIFIDAAGAVWFGGRNSLGMRLSTDGTQDTFNFPGSSDDIVGFVEQPDALYAIGRRSLYQLVPPLQWQIIGPLPLDPTANAIQAVVAGAEDFWVVGKSGAIVRVNRSNWLHAP